MNKEVFKTLLIANTKGNSIEQYVKEEHPLNTGWSFILVLNYCLSFALLGYVFAGFPNFDKLSLLLFVVLFPVGWVLLTQLNLYIISLLTGEYKTLVHLVYFRIVGIQLLGIIMFVICAVWILTSTPMKTVLLLTLIVVGIEFVVRMFKSIAFARQKRISWYYIILYICTLETLPLLVCYYLFVKGIQV